MKNIHLALELLTLIGSLEKPVYGFFVTSVTTVAQDKSFEEIELNLAKNLQYLINTIGDFQSDRLFKHISWVMTKEILDPGLTHPFLDVSQQMDAHGIAE